MPKRNNDDVNNREEPSSKITTADNPTFRGFLAPRTTPLHIAITHHNIPDALALLAQNVEVNIPDEAGYTPLNLAIFHGNNMIHLGIQLIPLLHQGNYLESVV